MGLEAATTIGGLVITNPDGGDGKFEGDNHIRMIKSVLQNTFGALLGGKINRFQIKGSNFSPAAADTFSIFQCTATVDATPVAAATLTAGWTAAFWAQVGNITINPNGAELINGAATLVIPVGSFAWVYCDGTQFHAFISTMVTPLSPPADGLIIIGSSAHLLDYTAIPVPFERPFNVSITDSVGANAMTVALKTRAGVDPSDTDPVFVPFRDASLPAGSYTVVKIAAALSMVISSGSTLGHGNAVDRPIYHYLINNAGVAEYAVSGKYHGDYGIVSTTAEGGGGAADSAATMYSTTARASVPFVCIGRAKSNQTTAGTWTATTTEKQLAPFDRKGPSLTTFTSGSGTYVPPWECIKYKARLVGGGGGSGSTPSGGGSAGGGNGGNTTLGGLTAGGGVASAAGGTGVRDGGAGGTASGGNINIPGERGGPSVANALPFSGKGGASVLAGAGASRATNGVGFAAVTNSGSGAGGAVDTANVEVSAGGGAGGYVEDITNTPVSVAYAVGAAGTAGAGGTAGAAGGAGLIIIDEFY